MKDRCPSAAELGQLLEADPHDPGTAVNARHVERCVRCQLVLEGLTAAPNRIAESTAVAGSSPALHSPTEAFIRRVKEEGLSSLAETPTADYRSWASERSAPLPTVPGYEILSEMGRGGMGVVYKARRQGLNRIVALKMILAGAQAGPKELARFRTEAEAAACLQHPNLVHIYDVGDVEGRPYLSLEYVNGGNLRERVDGTPQPALDSARLVELLARAVHYAHERGVVHRDLKPSNILLQREEGRGKWDEGKDSPFFIPHPSSLIPVPKISDFGLAKQLNSDAGQTATGDFVGTPSYMAPEQAGQGGRAVGPATDVYALGAILYELLTGRPPFKAATPLETVILVLHEEPVSIARLRPAIPRDLETICLKCLEKEPPRRYDSAQALAEDLQRFLANEPIYARAPSLPVRWFKFARRNKVLVGGMAAVFVALTLGTVTTTVFALAESRQRTLADQNALQADRSRNAALVQAYQARLAAALAALNDHDVAEAARQLDQAPATLRGWEWRHVKSRLDDSLAVVRGFRPDKGNAAFCPAGRRLIAATGEDAALVDALSGERLKLLAKGKNLVYASDSARGPLIFLQEDLNKPLRQIDLNGTLVRTFELLPEGKLMALAMNRAGSRLAVCSYATGSGNVLTLIDLTRSGGSALFAKKTRFWIYDLAFSSDGRWIASGGQETSVSLWNAETGDETAVLRGHTNLVRSLAFSPDGRRLVSGGDDQTIREWDVESRAVLHVRYGHIGSVQSLAYSPDGQWIASGGSDGTVRLWSNDGAPAAAVLHGHTDIVHHLEFSPDGTELASASRDGTARVWDARALQSPRILRDHGSYVYPVACSPDGHWIASGSWDQFVRLWDARSGELVATLRGHNGWIAGLAFTPDSSRLISRADDATLRTWSTATGECLSVQQHGGMVGPGDVHNVTVTADGTAVVCGLGSEVCFYEAQTGKEQRRLRLSISPIRVVVVSPDGAWLAAVGESTIQLVSLDTGQVAAVLAGHEARVQSVAFSPDNRLLVSAGQDKTLRLWDVRTGACQAVLKGHTDEVFAAVFHPDGSRIASGGRDRAIRIWDTSSGAELTHLQGHTDYVFSLAFSPDGNTLVSGSGDYAVRLWDTQPLSVRLRARRELQTIRPEADRLLAQWLAEEKSPAKVAARLRSDATLAEPLRNAVWHGLLRRANPSGG